MQSLPSSPHACAALCIMDVQRDRAMVKQLRSRYLWARDKLYCRRNEESHYGRGWELGRVKTFGGGSYRREMVNYDAAVTPNGCSKRVYAHTVLQTWGEQSDNARAGNWRAAHGRDIRRRKSGKSRP